MAQVPDGDQLLVDDCVPLAAVLEVPCSRKQQGPGSMTGAAREGAGAGKDSW